MMKAREQMRSKFLTARGSLTSANSSQTRKFRTPRENSTDIRKTKAQCFKKSFYSSVISPKGGDTSRNSQTVIGMKQNKTKKQDINTVHVVYKSETLKEKATHSRERSKCSEIVLKKRRDSAMSKDRTSARQSSRLQEFGKLSEYIQGSKEERWNIIQKAVKNQIN